MMTFSNASNSVSSLFTLSKRDDDFLQFEFRQVSEVKRYQYFRKRYIACFADICYSFQKIKMITSTGHNLPSSSSRLKVLKFFCLE